MEGRRARFAVGIAGAFVVWLVAGALLPRGLPLAIVLVGAVLGTVTALLAMGLILIYRTNRIINFAYGSMGGVAGVLAVDLFYTKHWNYWLAMALGLVVGVAVGGLTEFLIIRRFANSSRLVLTVATIGLAQVFGGFELLIPRWLDAPPFLGAFDTPLDVSFTIEPVIFQGKHLAIVAAVPAVIAGLAWFLLRTDAGVAVRAAAENSERALLLGIPIKRLSTILWMLAGGLATLTFVLKAPFAGTASGALSGPSLLLPALATAVIARMESLPVAFGAGVALGIIEQAVLWSYPPSSVDVVFLAVILGALLARRDRLTRASARRAGRTPASCGPSRASCGASPRCGWRVACSSPPWPCSQWCCRSCTRTGPAS
jgi:branched-chain amino acid transport system permease protein